MLREQAAATSSGPPSGVDIDKFLEEQGIAGVNKVCICSINWIFEKKKLFEKILSMDICLHIARESLETDSFRE